MIKHKTLLLYTKTRKEILTFCDIEIEKYILPLEKSYHSEDVEIDNVLVSNKVPSSKKIHKCFMDYLYDDYKIKPLHITLSKTSAYVKSYDVQTKRVYFLIENGDLMIFSIKPVLISKANWIAKLSTTTKVLKTKIKFTVMKLQNFTIKKFIAKINLDSVLKRDENFYPQVFFKSLNTLKKKKT